MQKASLKKSLFENLLWVLTLLPVFISIDSFAAEDSTHFMFSIPSSPKSSSNEFLLNINYSIYCDEINDAPENNNWFHGIHGTLTSGTSQIRVDLFESQLELEANLGLPESNTVTLNLDPNSHCVLKNLSGAIEIANTPNATNSAERGDY